LRRFFFVLALFRTDVKFATCPPVGDPDAGFLEQSCSSANTGRDFDPLNVLLLKAIHKPFVTVRSAFHRLYETVIWIEENRSAYCRFIISGEEPADKPDEQEDTP